MFWFGRPPIVRWMRRSCSWSGPPSSSSGRRTRRRIRSRQFRWSGRGSAGGVANASGGSLSRVSLEGDGGQPCHDRRRTAYGLRFAGSIAVPDGWWALALEVPVPLVPASPLDSSSATARYVPGVVIVGDESDSVQAPEFGAHRRPRRRRRSCRRRSSRPSGSGPDRAEEPTAHRRPPTADRRPPTADRRPPTADRRPPTAHRRPPTVRPSFHSPGGAKRPPSPLPLTGGVRGGRCPPTARRRESRFRSCNEARSPPSTPPPV